MTDHTGMNKRKAPNFSRSADAPVIRAGVMMANIIWNAMNSTWGMVKEYPGGLPSMLASPKKWNVPIRP